MHYELYNEHNDNTIIFLHGNSENLGIFNEYTKAFNNYKLLFIDSRGHGESTPGLLTYELMTLDILELVDKLNIKNAHIVGFSDGAIIALKMALVKPNLFNKLFLLGLNVSTDGLTDECIEYLKKEDSEYASLCLSEPNIPMFVLRTIQNRCVLINGEFDLIKESHLNDIAANIPNSSKYIIEGMDHFAVTKNPNRIIEIINNELNIEVYFETNHLICVNKPAGILSQEDITKSDDILTLTKSYLKIKYNKPNNVFLGLIQRLDRNVSGLMLFSKTSKSAQRMNENRPEKTYLAICKGSFSIKEDTIKNKIKKIEAKHISVISHDGKESITQYEVLDYKDGYSLLKVKIKTGRFHQIRVTMASLSHPLFNDSKYSNTESKDYRLGLDAYKIDFIDPITQEKKTVKRIPKFYPFNMFDLDKYKL